MTKIGIMGAGSAAKDLISILPAAVEVVGVGDNNAASHGRQLDGHAVMAVDELVAREPDHIVIAARAVDEMRGQLESLGYPAARILAFYPSYSDHLGRLINADIASLNAAIGLNLPAAGIATMYLWPEAPDTPRSAAGEDFVRRHAFRLAAERIAEQNVPGAIAELGVYRGEQAGLLNRMFPDRRLRLFDTFAGFAEKDIPNEAGLNLSGAAVGDFSDTSVELVLSRMADRSNVVIHQGFFPETAAGIEDEFAFVSLDVDLHDPTAAGLAWFYPRLAKGGYIFVHDYNNRRYLGVRRAVDDFVRETGACAVALPDYAGSIVIAK